MILKRWFLRRVRLKEASIYLFFSLTIYIFICLNQFDVKDNSPWKQQLQTKDKRRIATDNQQVDSLYFARWMNNQKSSSNTLLNQQIEDYLLQLENRLLEHRKTFDHKKIALIRNDNGNEITNWYERLLKQNGYQFIYNQNITDWNVNLNLFSKSHDLINEVFLDEENCKTIKYKNFINQLSILFSNRAYFCAAYSVIYKEISELNNLNNVISSCYILPEQINEFKEVAIALGKNVNWIVKKVYNSNLEQELNLNLIENKLDQVKNNFKPSSKSNAKLHSKSNQINQNDIFFKSNANFSKFNKNFNHQLDNLNSNSIKFGIEIIDIFSGQIFRSKHHSNDILKTINFKNFELQKLNNSIVYVQKQRKSNFLHNSIIPKKALQYENSNLNQILNIQKAFEKPFLLHVFNKQGKQFLNQFDEFPNLIRQNQFKSNLMVVEKEVSNLIQIQNNSFILKQYVLITNINPLRAYLYKEGLVFFVKNGTQLNLAAGFWHSDQLKQYLARFYSKVQIQTFEQNLIETLSKFLLIAEFHLITNFKFLQRFEFFDSLNFFKNKNHFKFNKKIKCNLKNYQLIEIELLLTEELKLFVIDINLEYNLFNAINLSNLEKKYRKELNNFHKNLIRFSCSVIGILPYQSRTSSFVSNNQKKNFKRSVRIQDLPIKYVHILQKQSQFKKRKLMFVKKNQANLKFNQFRTRFIKFLIDQNIGIMGLNCLIVHQLCLNEKDLEHLFSNNIELFFSSGSFIKLYPSKFMRKMNELIEHLNNKILSTFLNPINDLHRTFDLHNFVSKLEENLYTKFRFDTKNKSKSEQVEAKQNYLNFATSNEQNLFNVPFFNNSNNLLDFQDYYFYSSPNNHQNKTIEPANLRTKDTFISVPNCSLNLGSLNQLSLLLFEPNIISPDKLNQQNKQYQIKVHFNVIKLRLIASAAYCYDRIKFLEIETTYLNVSLNLGIGLNKISFSIRNYSQANAVKNFFFWIYRQSLNELSTYRSHPNLGLFICQINQNCNFILYENNTCGLTLIAKLTSSVNAFDNYLQNVNLPICKGHEPGRWLIKCNNCDDRFSCDQSSQTWLPYSCRYKNFNTNEMQQCFQDKNIMFIGDSTNRGIMHHLIEQINSSLYSYEKIHNSKVYTNLNNHQTTFAFSYYPQFWKGQNMPSLSVSLIKLTNLVYHQAKRQNVFVIGGVHWLSTKHIHLLRNLIKTIPNSKLILKSLGSGFHQHVNNVHYLSIDAQRKFVNHNKNLISVAKQNNVTILDTFNITNFVYDAFYPGRCSCHFYKVKKNNNNRTYHVEGLLNSLYTKMITNLICN